MVKETRDFLVGTFFRCIRCGEMFGVSETGEAEAHVKRHEADEALEFPGGHTHGTDHEADTCPLCFPSKEDT